jgi:hypothetical protein
LVERLKEVTAFDFIHVATFDKEILRRWRSATSLSKT